jgi:tetratricopeptide (TPR) repeat protein
MIEKRSMLLCLVAALALPLASAAGADGPVQVGAKETLVVVQPAPQAYAAEGGAPTADSLWPTLALTDALSGALGAVPGYRVQLWRPGEGSAALTAEQGTAELSRMADIGVAYLVQARAVLQGGLLNGNVTIRRPPQEEPLKALTVQQAADATLAGLLRQACLTALQGVGLSAEQAQQAAASQPGTENTEALQHYYQGAAMWQLADSAGARKEYEAAVALDARYQKALKAVAGALYQEGVDAYSAGDLKAAVAKFEAAAQRYTEAGDQENAILSVAFAHLYQGEALWSAGDKEAALEHFRAAAAESMKGEQHALLPKAHISYGAALWEWGQKLLAAAKEQEALDALQNAAAQYGIAGQLHERAVCLAAASAVLEKLNHPEEAGEGYLEAGRLLVQVGEYELARPNLGKVRGLDAKLAADALVLQALCDLRTTELGPLKELLDNALNAVLADDTAGAQPTLTRARLLAQRAGIGEADVLIGRALEKLQQGQTDPAAQDITDAKKPVRETDNLRRARRLLAEAVGLDDNHVWAHKYLGDALMRLGELSGAIEQYARVQALLPNDEGPDADLGEAYLKSNLYTKAEETFLAGLKLVAPDNTEVAWRLERGLGDVSIKLRKYAQARDAYKQALELFPFDVQSLLSLVVAQYHLKEYDEGMRNTELAATLASDNPEVVRDANRLADLIRTAQERERKLKQGNGG